jgi:hypothetical protein
MAVYVPRDRPCLSALSTRSASVKRAYAWLGAHMRRFFVCFLSYMRGGLTFACFLAVMCAPDRHEHGLARARTRMAPNPQNKVSRFLLVADLVLSYEFSIEIKGEVDVINNV